MSPVSSPAAAHPAPAASTPPTTLRVGIAGLGRAGDFFHCRPLAHLPGFELGAVQDRRAEVADAVAARFGCRTVPTFEALVAERDIDLVVVATPTHSHRDLALQAIAAGKPVLVEKPFARSPAEAQEIFEAGRRAGVFVGAYHNRRYDPDVLALQDILHSGVLGTVVKVSIHLHNYIRRKDWQTLRAMGGGTLANWGAHAIDWCYQLFGPELVLSDARLFRVLNPGDAEDCFLLSLDAGRTRIEVEYMNCAAYELPKWHVVGQYGTAMSENRSFRVRYCDPARFAPIEADRHDASDGTYGIKEDLGWMEKSVPWGDWDNCPLFYRALHGHLTGNGPAPVAPEHVLSQLRLMEAIRARPCHDLTTPAPGSNGRH